MQTAVEILYPTDIPLCLSMTAFLMLLNDYNCKFFRHLSKKFSVCISSYHSQVLKRAFRIIIVGVMHTFHRPDFLFRCLTNSVKTLN